MFSPRIWPETGIFFYRGGGGGRGALPPLNFDNLKAQNLECRMRRLNAKARQLIYRYGLNRF